MIGRCAGQKQDQSEGEEEVTAKQPVMLGRKDYLIRSLDPATGTEHWNVTYSEIVHLDVEQPLAYEATSSEEVASWNSLDGALLSCLSTVFSLVVDFLILKSQRSCVSFFFSLAAHCS